MRVVSKDPFLIHGGSRYLGSLYQADYPQFVRFLEKFGKRMSLDDLIENFLFGRGYTRWEISCELLASAYRLWRQNSDAFVEVLHTARDSESFSALTVLG